MTTEMDRDVALAEYGATHAAYLHYDNFSWQVGSVLIAAVFVFLGFLMQVPKEQAAGLFELASCFVAGVMTVWLLYTSHNRQIYIQKLDRIREIENQFGMLQHVGWSQPASAPRYTSSWPGGHFLDQFVYLLVCSMGPVIGWFRIGYTDFSLFPFLIVLFGLMIVHRNQRLLNEHRRSVQTLNSEQSPASDSSKATADGGPTGPPDG